MEVSPLTHEEIESYARKLKLNDNVSEVYIRVKMKNGMKILYDLYDE